MAERILPQPATECNEAIAEFTTQQTGKFLTDMEGTDLIGTVISCAAPPRVPCCRAIAHQNKCCNMSSSSSATVFLLLLVGCRGAEPRPEKPPVDPRERLLKRIGDINDFSRPRPLVTLEEFFEGNNDMGSIGYNLPDPPKPKDFYDFLKGIRGRADVSDIRIAVMDQEDPKQWPSTDTIWIITSASPEQVRSWFPKRLAPDDVWDGFAKSATKFEAYEIPKGMRAVGAWYD